MYLHSLTEIDSPYLAVGRRYLDEKRVQNLTCNSDGVWSAQITESDNCFVTVKVIDKQVQSSNCTCSFKGLHCIHKVAVYRAINEAMNMGFSVPKETVRTKYLLSDEQKQRWENDLLFQDVAYKIFEQSNNEYEDSNRNNLQLAYDQQLKEAIERAKTEPLEAFGVVMVCYKLWASLDGVHDNKINEAMKRVIAAIQDKQTAKKIEELLRNIGPVSTLLQYQRGIEFYFMILIELSPILQSNEEVKKVINQTNIQVDCIGITEIEENNKKKLKELYLVKLALKNNHYEDIKLYYTKHFVSSEACLLIVNYAYEKQDFKELLSLCLKVVDKSMGDGRYIRDFLEKIIEIYGKMGEIEKQRQYGYKLALETGNINQLKVLYKENSELWNDIFLKFMDDMDRKYDSYSRNFKSELLERKWLRKYNDPEIRYKELMECCMRSPQDSINYAMELSQYDRSKVISLVASYLSKEMKQANNRDKYYKVAKQLKHYMETGYYEEAQELKDIFVNLYPRRAAMKEELEIAKI